MSEKRIKELEEEIESLKAQTVNMYLGNLLAVIHRDGGQYQSEHGTERAVSDALKKIPRMQGRLNELESDLDKIEERNNQLELATPETYTKQMRELLSQIL